MQIGSDYGSERCVCEPIELPSPASFLSHRRADSVEITLAVSTISRAVEDLQNFNCAHRKVGPHKVGLGQTSIHEVSYSISFNDRPSTYSFLNLCQALALVTDRYVGNRSLVASSATVLTH